MKRIGILTIGIFVSIHAYSQTFTIQAGPSISNMDWKVNGANQWYSQNLIGYSFFVGLDYLDKPYFNLSSNLGMIRKGGKDEVTFHDVSGVPIKSVIEKPSLDYVSLNTTADLKYKLKAITPFISAGPRVDLLVNQSQHFDGVENYSKMNQVASGLILGAGLKYNLSAFELGLRANYYLEFTKVAAWTIPNTNNGGEISVNTLAVNLSVGYKLN